MNEPIQGLEIVYIGDIQTTALRAPYIEGIEALMAEDPQNLAYSPWETALVRSDPRFHAVGVYEQKVVGVSLCGHHKNRGTVSHIIVTEPLRRHHVGRLLVESQLARLRENGVKTAHVITVGGNVGGNRFWEKLGFTSKHNTVLMEKDIDPKLCTIRPLSGTETITNTISIESTSISFGSFGVRGYISDIASDGLQNLNQLLFEAYARMAKMGIERIHILVDAESELLISNLTLCGFNNVRNSGETLHLLDL